MKTLGVTAAAWSGGGRVGAEVDRHGGESRVSLSRREGIRVADVMAPPPPSVPSHLSIAAARKIGALRSTQILLVEVEELLVGLLDLSAVSAEDDGDSVAMHVQSLSVAVSPSATVGRARELLVAHGASCLPVVAGFFLVGTLCRARLEHVLAEPVPSPQARAAA